MLDLWLLQYIVYEKCTQLIYDNKMFKNKTNKKTSLRSWLSKPVWVVETEMLEPEEQFRSTSWRVRSLHLAGAMAPALRVATTEQSTDPTEAIWQQTCTFPFSLLFRILKMPDISCQKFTHLARITKSAWCSTFELIFHNTQNLMSNVSFFPRTAFIIWWLIPWWVVGSFALGH